MRHSAKLRNFGSIVATAFALFVIIQAFSSCDPQETTKESLFLNKIKGNWHAESIHVDGTFVNGAFDGFSITFSDSKGFTTLKGNNPIWPPSGTITLKEVNSTVGYDLLRNDGVEINVTELTDNRLVLKFHYDVTVARRSSVGGEYTFELTR